MQKLFVACVLLGTAGFGCATEAAPEDARVMVDEGSVTKQSDDGAFHEMSANCPTDQDQLLINGRTTAFMQALRLVALKGVDALPATCTPGYCLPTNDDDWGWQGKPYGASLNEVLRRLATGEGGSSLDIKATTHIKKSACDTEMIMPSNLVGITGTAKTLMDSVIAGPIAHDELNIRVADVPDNGTRWTTYVVDDFDATLLGAGTVYSNSSVSATYPATISESVGAPLLGNVTLGVTSGTTVGKTGYSVTNTTVGYEPGRPCKVISGTFVPTDYGTGDQIADSTTIKWTGTGVAARIRCALF